MISKHTEIDNLYHTEITIYAEINYMLLDYKVTWLEENVSIILDNWYKLRPMLKLLISFVPESGVVFNVHYNWLGMQRVGKFPGILETFHGKFQEFWRGGNFQKFGEFSILTYFQHFKRLFAQKSTELNFLSTIFKHTCTAPLLFFFFFDRFIGLYRSIESTTRLYYEISLNLICEAFIKLIFYAFHIVFRISRETPDWKKSFGNSTVNLICDTLKQNREQVAQVFFEIWTIQVGIGVKNN